MCGQHRPGDQPQRTINLSALATDCSISHVTASTWLTVLEDSHLIFRLPAYPNGFGKRAIKTPKLYFLDTGLASWLLGIKDTDLLNIHPQRSALFETWVISNLVKYRGTQAKATPLYFWRDNAGSEIDLIIDRDGELTPIEIKSGATLVGEWIQGMDRWATHVSVAIRSSTLIYGGTEEHTTGLTHVAGWPILANPAKLFSPGETNKP